MLPLLGTDRVLEDREVSLMTITTRAPVSVGNICLHGLLDAWMQGDPVAGAATADYFEENGATGTAAWVRERLCRLQNLRDSYMAPLDPSGEALTTAQKRNAGYVHAFQRSVLCVDPLAQRPLDFGRDTPVSGKIVALRLRLRRLGVCGVQVLHWPGSSDRVSVQYRILGTHSGHPALSHMPRQACPDCAAVLRAGLWLLALLETLLPPAARNGDTWQLFNSPTQYPSLWSRGWEIWTR
jgi:hypothetical protein